MIPFFLWIAYIVPLINQKYFYFQLGQNYAFIISNWLFSVFLFILVFILLGTPTQDDISIRENYLMLFSSIVITISLIPPLLFMTLITA